MPNIKVTNSSSQSVPQVNDFPIAFHQDPDKAIPGEMRWEKSRLRGLNLNFSSCLSKQHLKSTNTNPQRLKFFVALHISDTVFFVSRSSTGGFFMFHFPYHAHVFFCLLECTKNVYNGCFHNLVY